LKENVMGDGPLEVLEERRRVVVARDMEAFAELFAEDGVIEVPFAGNGAMPARLVGREAVREFSVGFEQRPWEITDLRIREVHRTVDPEVVIVELTTVGRVALPGSRSRCPASRSSGSVTGGSCCSATTPTRAHCRGESRGI
jgi:hypothetical protein